MKVIFLDVDGVLNNDEYFERTKNEKIINIVKKYLVWSIDVNINSKNLIIVAFQV